MITFPGKDKVPTLREGEDYRVVTRLPFSVNGVPYRHVGLLSADLAYGVLSPADASGVPGAPGPPPTQKLVELKPRTGDLRVLADHGTRSRPTYISTVARNDKYIVWIENPETNLYAFSWEMYSFELSTGKEKKIASYRELGIKQPPWPSMKGIRPQLAGDNIYWVAVAGLKDPRSADSGRQDTPDDAAERDGFGVQTGVFEVPADGSATMKRIASGIQDVTDVFPDGDNLVLERRGRADVWNLSSGRRQPPSVARVQRPCGIDFNEGVLAQCSGNSAIVITEPSGKVTTLTNLPGPVQYLNVTSRWVGFSNEEQAYLFDLKRGRFGRLAGASALSDERFKGGQLHYYRQSFTPRADDATFPLIELTAGSNH